MLELQVIQQDDGTAPAAYANSNITNTQTHTHTSVMLRQVSTGGTHLYVQVCVQHVRLMITSQ